jgi:hypothetical protein
MNTRPREGLDDLVVGVTPRFGEATSSRTQHQKSKKKYSVTAYVDNNCSFSLPALDRNCLCVVEVPSVAGRCFTQRLAELGSMLHDIKGYAGVPPRHTNNFGHMKADY